MATPSITPHESFASEYDVFLSFRGEDTRKNFTDHLYSALHQAGIRTFRDEEELTKGEYLAPELVKAIQSSRIAVIVLSKDYASSRWCLDELVEIVELKEKGKLRVFPIFYNVDPSEVRKQSGSYGMALAKHKERFRRSDKVQKWIDALTKVADMSGWDLQGMANGYEANFINSIIKEVQQIVSRVPMFIVEHGVGLDSRVERVVQLLQGESNDGVRMVGIYGMGGIGKTTLAKAVYNKLFVYFESSCFLEIDSAISGQEGNGINLEKVDNQIKNIQKQLFKKLFNEEIDICSTDEGIMLMKRRLQARKCLIVLDNLEHRNQFNKLCGGRDWFGGGSRLILTTREAHVFKALNVDEHYEVKVLNHEESLQLFSLHAFGEPPLQKEDYNKLLNNIVAYCGGLPLALEVLGAYLRHKSKKKWINAFEKLKGIPHNDIQAKLKISYDGLPDDHIKSLFLDLVCFSNGVSKEKIDNMGYFLDIEIQDLVDKCLINCVGYWVSMHSLIREMGRKIIRSESPNNPGERSRLWCPYDIHDVLIGEKGTEKIEMIVLNSPMQNMEYTYNTKAFKDMKNLRFLQIDGIHLGGNFKHLPCKALRCLIWNQSPSKYISSGYFFEKLVKLEMRESNIKEFGSPIKYFQCLKSLDLGACEYLTRTPDFSGAKNLRKLSFGGCLRLEKVHSSIGDLGMLVELNLGRCERLKKLPKKFWHWQLRSVEDPSSSSSVCYSSKIKELGENWGMLTSLRRLDLSDTNIQSLPSNTSHLLKPPKSIPNLRRCFFQNDHLQLIPQFPPNLEVIDLSFCNNLEVVSATFPTFLKEFWIIGCTKLEIVSAPLPTSLREINLFGCTNLKMLPQLPQNLESLFATDCESLETVHLPKKLKLVHVVNCKKLKEIQGWENALFLRDIKLRGVPNIKFSENINKVLKVSKFDSKIRFEGHLPKNENFSWIKFGENGSSSISFQWPQLISNLELLGICIWVVYPHDEYYGRIEKDGFEFWSRRWYSFLDAYSEAELLEEGGYDSIVDFIPQESFEDIKAGEIFKLIPKLINIPGVFESFSKFKYVKKGMEHKVRVEVLYRDREDGLLQFLPLTKLDSNTDDDDDDEVLYRDREDGVLQFLDDDDDDEEEEEEEGGGFLQFLDDDDEEEEEEEGGDFLQFLDDDDEEEEEEEEDGFLQFDEEEEEDDF